MPQFEDELTLFIGCRHELRQRFESGGKLDRSGFKFGHVIAGKRLAHAFENDLNGLEFFLERRRQLNKARTR